MRKSIAKSRMLLGLGLGLGLAAILMIGCQQPETMSGADKVEDRLVDQAPEELSLKLTVRQTEECRSLREKVQAARKAGQVPGDREAGFIAQCLEEVKSGDGSRIAVPVELQPDPATRCRWIVAQIDGGREELVIKFRYYCPDECVRIAALADTARQEKYCRDPGPDCAGLKRRLEAMDPASEEYARLRRFIAENCVAVPPRDTVRNPGDTLRPPVDTLSDCEILLKRIRSLGADTADHARLRRLYDSKCGGQDTVLTPCEAFRRRLASVDTNAAEYGRLLARYTAECIEPRPVTYCDSLRNLLRTALLDSAALARVKRELAARCGTDRPPVDSLGCDDIRARLAGMSMDSDAYVRQRNRYNEMCVRPGVPVTDCEAYRTRLAHLNPATEEYAKARALVAEKCQEAMPVR